MIKEYNKKNSHKVNKLSLCFTVATILIGTLSNNVQANTFSENNDERMQEKIIQLRDNIRIDTESLNILSIATNIKILYGSNSVYSGLSQTYAIEQKVFPQQMIIPAGIPINIWKGDVAIAFEKKESYGDLFSITYKNVPKSACSKLVSNIADNFYMVYVNNKVIKNEKGFFNIKELKKVCENGNYNNTIKLISF